MSESVPTIPPSRQFIQLPSSPTSTSLLYQAHAGTEISDELMTRCAQLFSKNYGIWGPNAEGPKPGLS